MVFNSITFVIFFAIVLALHHLPLSWNVKKTNLLIASYIFYAAWNPPFVILLWITTIVDWFVARAIAKTESHAKRRMFLWISLAGNLGLLGYFKYGTFILESFVAVVAYLGVQYHPAAPDIILPIGISFYTFVTLSYTIDVYRNEIPPCKSFLDFSLLVTFFPHLVAGPILRAADFLPQCEKPRVATSQQLGWGFALIVFGLFEKVVLADSLVAPVADKLFIAAKGLGFWQAWIGTFAFASQIYLDFDGYSITAIGVAMCLGFVFPDNFRFPYAAVGFSDFWRRWHISLSSWLRDYLYVSLGGNRKGATRTYINLMLTMLIGGLWHGAAWRFVIWGGLHGLYLVGERLLQNVFSGKAVWKKQPVQILLAVLTFLLVCLTWIFFRADNLLDAWQMVLSMFGFGVPLQSFYELGVDTGEIRSVLLVMLTLLVMHWKLRHASLEQAADRFPMWVRSVVLAGLLWFIVLVQGDNRAFIYFQF
jgi:D-alanyl-lipoteichoic acid acyltransferase DltB (MBOAT superfamily)